MGNDFLLKLSHHLLDKPSLERPVCIFFGEVRSPKLYSVVKLQFWSSRECGVNSSLLLFLDPLEPVVVVPVRVSSMKPLLVTLGVRY